MKALATNFDYIPQPKPSLSIVEDDYGNIKILDSSVVSDTPVIEVVYDRFTRPRRRASDRKPEWAHF